MRAQCQFNDIFKFFLFIYTLAGYKQLLVFEHKIIVVRGLFIRGLASALN